MSSGGDFADLPHIWCSSLILYESYESVRGGDSMTFDGSTILGNISTGARSERAHRAPGLARCRQDHAHNRAAIEHSYVPAVQTGVAASA